MIMLKTKLLSCDSLKKVVAHLETYGFVKLISNNNEVKNFRFGPLGELLMYNLKREWIHFNVNYRDHNVFLFDPGNFKQRTVEDTRDAFGLAKEFCKGEAPFGLAEVRREFSEENKASDYILNPNQGTLLRHLTILPPGEAEQFFYIWQQNRKRWLRMFSVDPARFKFSEIENLKEGIGAKVNIIASFEWGDHCLETIHYHGTTLYSDLDMPSQSFFSVLGKGKRSLAHVVECRFNLDLAAVTYMCDSFKEKKALKNVCIFHRKLAPYKFSFAAGPASSAKVDELMELAKFLGMGLKKVGLSTFLAAKDMGRKSLSSQLTKFSALGIPYTLVLTEETLETGIAGLYSLRTTLQEEVHVGNFVEYCEKLMKNY